MRFLSHIRNFSVQIVEPRTHATQYGDIIVDREGYVADFRTHDVTETDIQFAEDVFVKQGLLYGRTTQLDEVTATPLLTRLSVFDTDERALVEGWDPEFKKLVEDKLMQRAENHPDYRLVTREPIEAPWPRYLDFRGSLEQLLQKVVEDGYDVRQVIAFERQSGQRPQVVEALERLLVEQEVAQTAEPRDEVPA